MNFCPVVDNLYPRTPASFGIIISLFIKMALIVQPVLIVFTISSFEFTKLNLCDFTAKKMWAPSSTVGKLVKSHHKLLGATS